MSKEIGLEGMKYDAFISYRHSELDSFVAENLHKTLESFKLPGSVIRNKKANGESVSKTKISRVFRDKEELPLVTNLADPITDALKNSDFLLVICSPRLKESMWCRKEIETFISMHGRERVLAVLIEGEPDISFPDELLYREETVTLPDGSTEKRKIPVEPLAADVRGRDKKEIRKKIKEEVIRIAAPMFGCNYDDLKQRHKEQRLHRILAVSLSITAAALIFGAVSTSMALKIKKQNKQITEQNEQISSQAKEIEKQYIDATINASVSQANESEALLKTGDRMAAIDKAAEAVSNSMIPGIDEVPSKACLALSDSLYMYENGYSIIPDRLLEADSTINYVVTSQSGARLALIDGSGCVSVFSSADFSKRIRIEAADSYSFYENMVAFAGDDKIIIPSGEELIMYALTEDEARPEKTLDGVDYCGALIDADKSRAFLVYEDRLDVLDYTKGSITDSIPYNLEGYAASPTSELKLSDDAGMLAIEVNDGVGVGRDSRLLIYDTVDGIQLNNIDLDYAYVNGIVFDDDRVYVVNNADNNKLGEDADTSLSYDARLVGNVSAYNVKGTAKLWEYEREGQWFDEVNVARAEGSDIMAVAGYADLTTLSKSTGEVIDNYSFGSEVVRLGNYVNTTNFMIITRDEEWHYLNAERKEDLVTGRFTNQTSNNIKTFELGNDYYVTLPYNSNTVTIYRTALGPNMELMTTAEASGEYAATNADGSLLAVSDYTAGNGCNIEIFDTSSGNLNCSLSYEGEYYKDMFFAMVDGGVELIVVTGDKIRMINPTSGTETAVIEPDEFELLGYIDSNGIGDYIYAVNNGNIAKYNYRTGESDILIEKEGIVRSDLYAVANDETKIARLDRVNDSLEIIGSDGNIITTVTSLKESLGINTSFTDNIFFDLSDNYVYAVYRDGSCKAVDIGASGTELPYEYSDLKLIPQSVRRIEGTDLGILKGITTAYLIRVSTGEPIAYIKGYLAVNGADNKLYVCDREKIYSSPIASVEDMLKLVNDM